MKNKNSVGKLKSRRESFSAEHWSSQSPRRCTIFNSPEAVLTGAAQGMINCKYDIEDQPLNHFVKNYQERKSFIPMNSLTNSISLDSQNSKLRFFLGPEKMSSTQQMIVSNKSIDTIPVRDADNLISPNIKKSSTVKLECNVLQSHKTSSEYEYEQIKIFDSDDQIRLPYNYPLDLYKRIDTPLVNYG